MTAPPSLSILAPRLPESREPQAFPVIAAVAPVLMGLAIWAMTRSPLSLVFAGLGPLIALGSMVDSRVQSRRFARRESVRFDGELAAARAELVAAHETERAMLEREHPPAAGCLSRARASEWMPGAAVPRVRIGSGSVPSAVVIDGLLPTHRGRSPEQRALDDLSGEASSIRDAALAVDARLGIGVVASGVGGDSLFRALVMQLASTLGPDEWTVRCDLASESWLRDLPHSIEPGESGTVVFVRGDGDSVLVAHSKERARLPAGIGVVIDDRSFEVDIGDGADVSVVDALERISRAQAQAWARRLALEARERGILRAHSTPPSRLAFADLERGSSSALSAIVGHDGADFVSIDLVGDGPHAVIGGTSGSGKSELLITWILALAASNAPTEVSFLLIDFKGGASFGAVAQLPHCVGLLTDLDPSASERALESLAAEVRHRERELARQGVRDVTDATGLARLLIVVDEFATLATEFPHLHALFTDLAARGRSLGIHLILCTQRPAGVVRDAVLANVGIRLSLRVNDRADSLALIGSAEASTIPATARGRAYLAAGGREARAVQVALASETDISAIAATTMTTERPRRPWLEPLALEIGVATLPPSPRAVVLGIADHPREQSQPIAQWHPPDDGSLVIIGAAGSGKTTALATIAHGATRDPARIEIVRADPLAAWDVVTRALADIRGESAVDRRLILIDDLDVVLDRLGAEHAAVLADHVQAVVREGAAVGIHCVLTMQRVTSALQPIVSLSGSRILLRLADRHEHVFAGGTSHDFSADLPPGRGWWRGHPLQLASGAPAPRVVEPRVEWIDGGESPLAIVSPRPAPLLEALSQLGRAPSFVTIGSETLAVSAGEPGILVGDPDEWQASWGAVARIRRHRALVVHGCSTSEYRALTKQRDLPPPLAPRGGQFWLLKPDGEVVRAAVARVASASDSAQF